MDEHHVNDLWEDMDRLNSLYVELMWENDDELQFTIEGDKIVITNKSLEECNVLTVYNLKRNQITGSL